MARTGQVTGADYKSTKSMPAVAPFTHGCGPPAHGNIYTSILLVRSKVKCFFVLVDAHLKWLEVVKMKSTTAEKTVKVVRTLFGSLESQSKWCPITPPVSLDEFSELMGRDCIKHIRSTLYHPSTNGLAERFVQTFKRAL